MQHGPWLKDLLVFLVAAGLVVPLFHRARVGAVLGFLLVGIAVGPFGFGQLAEEFPWIRYLTIEDRERAEPFAELGVMFLLFLVGIEVSVERLWSLRRFVAGIGGMQFFATFAVLAAVLALTAVGGEPAVILGLALAMSSTAVVMQILEEQGRTATPLGQVAIAVLLFQDLMVAPVLLGVEILARGAATIAFGLVSALLQAGVAVAAILLAGHYVLRPLFRFAAQTGSRELIMAMTLLMVIGIAAAAGAAGLSTALGAFLAGVLLSETEYRHQVEVDVAPFKGLLVGLFFITVGMTLDLRAVWNGIGMIAIAVVALLAFKAAILFAAGRLFGLAVGVAAEVAVLLSQAGEFAFIVIGLGRTTGLMPAEIAQFATAVVAVSMVLTPLCAPCGRWLAERCQRAEYGGRIPTGVSELSDHVVIGGYGRVGQAIGRLLQAENVPFIALDTDGALVSEQRRNRVFFGDAGRREFLRHAGAARARAFVVTVNAPRAAERMVAAARAERPDAPVFARARDPQHAARLLKLGAVGVIPEAVEASLQLGARLLEGLGLPDEAIAQRLHQMREQEVGRLKEKGPLPG